MSTNSWDLRWWQALAEQFCTDIMALLTRIALALEALAARRDV